MADEATTTITLHPIGVIHTPFQEQVGTPIQTSTADDTAGHVELFPGYEDGLRDLDGFERIWLIYCFHRARSWRPLIVPYRDTVERGVFATRAPARPVPVGLSAVRLVSVQGRWLEVRGVDILDGTPLLDIKPYVPEFDAFPGSKAGWLAEGGLLTRRADDRFRGPEG
jgi:tRNA-Thr(GGU) m(6)t(6)A37 methyltransferase TsaA